MRKLSPSLGELEAVTKQSTLNTSLAGTHNEGVPMKQLIPLWLAAKARLKNGQHELEILVQQLGRDNLTKKIRGTRQTGKAQPNSDEDE